MYKLTVTNPDNQTIELTRNDQYSLINISGLTPSKASINYSNIVGSDNLIFNSAKMGTRNLILTILPESPVEKNRINLYNFFRIKQLVKIEYSNNSRNVAIEGYVESIEGSIFSRRQELRISIICLQPYFKDAVAMIEELSQILNLFEFPFAIEEEGIPFSEIDKTYMKTVVNRGDVSCGMTILLQSTGTVKNPIIYDATNRTKFGLNVTMNGGDLIRINTNHGQKSVALERNGVSTNIIGNIVSDSVWFQLDPGDTIFAYDADTGTSLLIVTFIHSNMYGGV